MKTYICEICGDAYLGESKPPHCPFCGAREHFIKEGAEAHPIVNEEIEVSDKDRENLMETLHLEVNAVAEYKCMAGKTDKYEIKAMYKRLAKVESEHAEIVCKILKIEEPEAPKVECSDEDSENFEKTIALEDNASVLYSKFAQETSDESLKKFFGALTVVEREHIDLINQYI
jgi:rubrerythrin